MAKHKTHTLELKRQVVQEYLAGETLHNLARRHNLPRNLIRIWVDRQVNASAGTDPSDAVTLDEIAQLAQTIHECESRIEAIEGLIAKRTNEFKGQTAAGDPEGQGTDAPAPDAPGTEAPPARKNPD